MRAIQLIAEEHRHIERMLACLQRILEDSARQARVAARSAAPLMALFEYVVDGTHQRKEEAVLCARLLQVTPLSEKSALARVLGEHEGERRLIRDLNSNLLPAIAGVPDSLDQFLRLGRAYVEMHAEHIAMENEVLLPMAVKRLDPADDPALVEAYLRIEARAGISSQAAFRCIDEFERDMASPRASQH